LWVHLNGRLVADSEARVSVFDRGFLYGDGVFESLRAVGGGVFRLDRHLQRLRRSADGIGLDLPVALSGLAAAVGDLLEANRLRDARIRVTVTRGAGRPGEYVEADGPATVVISSSGFGGLDPALHREGVAAAIPSRRQIPAEALDPQIKSTSRLGSVLARREARNRGAFEAILLDGLGNLTEGTVSNVFLVEGGRLRTPPAPSGGLPGITREAVIEIARAASIEVTEEPLPSRRLFAADEVFLTNTSWEVLPVVRVEGRPVGGGIPGAVARDLLERYRDVLRRECATAAAAAGGTARS
jgi:branched-chain amino acid aminotransferase